MCRLWNGWINFLNCSGNFFLSVVGKQGEGEERRQEVQIRETRGVFPKKLDWITLFRVKRRLCWFASQQNKPLPSCVPFRNLIVSVAKKMAKIAFWELLYILPYLDNKGDIIVFPLCLKLSCDWLTSAQKYAFMHAHTHTHTCEHKELSWCIARKCKFASLMLRVKTSTPPSPPKKPKSGE